MNSRKKTVLSPMQSLVVAACVIMLFVGVIFVYYANLRYETRQRIMLTGELNAFTAAEQIDSYLSTGVDAMRLIGYSLDNMIREGRSEADILDYLCNESAALTNIATEYSTGVYGYIGGVYMDGTGWVPDADYVPTERPWYVDAQANIGKVALVDPYVDMQTGTVKITLAKTLCDAKSVVAMDISMERLQAITEEIAAQGESDMEIILDGGYQVMAHSDVTQLGRDYTVETGTFGSAIYEQLRSSGESSFSIRYDGAEYIVYASRVANIWTCLSVIDATSVLAPLQRSLLFTILTALVVVAVLIVIMMRSVRHSRIAEQLNRRISSIANIYTTAYELDVAGDRFAEIKSDNKAITDIIGDQRACAQDMLRMVMERVTDDSCLEEMERFIDLSSLDERLRETNTIALEFMNRNGLWRRARYVVSARDREGRVTRALWLAEDIDQEKRERDRLLDMSERAIAASEAKSAFLSNMSHEIRTPINAVLGMNEMILRESEDENVLAYAESIHTAGSTLLGIVNDILDFSKIEAGKMEILPVDYDLSSVLNDLVNMVRIRSDKKGLALALDFDETTPKLLHGDEVRIKQIITNILTNAVKYTERGTVTFHVGYERVPDEPDAVLLDVSVRDTGIGIKPEDMTKLFSEFERIEETRNRSIEGTGLGMNITKRLLEMMGASLQVESVYGEGSTFSFRLRQTVAGWEPLGDYEASYRASVAGHKKYRESFTAPDASVLVVDDTPMNLMVFRSLLKRTRIQIDTAASGDEGLTRAGDRKYDLIFLDHMMPEKDGIETLRELREQTDGPNAGTAAVCLTANAISGAREKYLAAGFDDYLTKPIDASKLEELLIRYLPDEKIRAAEPDVEAAEPAEALPEFAAQLEDIDAAAGVANCGGVDTFRDALELFYRSIGAKADEIEGFWRGGDLKNYTVKVHALKSSARTIGATALSELAKELEDAARIDGRTPELLALYRGFAEKLKPVFDGGDDAREPIPAALLASAYDSLAECAGIMDYDLAEMALDSLKEYRLPEEDAKRVEELRAALVELDWERIAALCKR